jgi:molecular chaperone HscB
LLRAQYLLRIKYDIDVMSEDNSSHPTDQETLMEVMDAQEGIEQARDQTEIDRLKEENSVRIDETIEKLGKAFEAGDAETAKNECVRLKYWRSLHDGLESWEPGKEVRLIH